MCPDCSQYMDEVYHLLEMESDYCLSRRDPYQRLLGKHGPDRVWNEATDKLHEYRQALVVVAMIG